jgi:hypothetical protein
MKLNIIYLGICLLAGSIFADGQFPEQKPAGEYRILQCNTPEESICGAALQGLVAKAVNNGTLNELLVMNPKGAHEKEWILRTEKRTEARMAGTLSLMEAADRYKPLIKGYILYSPDNSEGDNYQIREETDRSANTATMIAGLRDALPVSDKQEPAFQTMGLKKLLDARDVSFADALKKPGLNQTVTCSLDPRAGNLRDLAVAHQMVVYFGNEEAEPVTKRMNAPFMILGWGAGDEFKHVAPASRQGGIETVSNWTRNLSFLSAGARAYHPRPIRPFNPTTIDWDDTRRTVSFMLSDGDNTGWMLNSFWNPPFYGSKETGTFPMGFSAALAQMAQMAPVVVDRLAETQPDDVSLIEFGGGYFYPDLLGEERNEREDILRSHARQLNEQMKKTGARLLCFIVNNSASSEAQAAYQIFAEELQTLDGMMVMDYAPYHKGAGEIHWAEKRDGIEIPVITARFCMWEKMSRPNAGSPGQIANFIHQDTVSNSWIAVHAWSNHDGKKGVDAAAACIDQLTPDVHVVTPEEMVWRIRMAHNPVKTKRQLLNRKYTFSQGLGNPGEQFPIIGKRY